MTKYMCNPRSALKPFLNHGAVVAFYAITARGRKENVMLVNEVVSNVVETSNLSEEELDALLASPLAV